MLEGFLGLGLLLVELDGGLCCAREHWVHVDLLLARLMQCLPSRLTAQARAAAAGRSTPVLSSTSSSHPTPPPPRTGEVVALLPGRVGSGVMASDLPFASSVEGESKQQAVMD